VAAVAVLALVTAGCGGGDDDERADDPGDRPAKTSTTNGDGAKAKGASTTQADPEELEALMVSEVPTGYVLQPDDVGDTGPSDLDKAARDQGEDPAESRAFLEEAGFRRGYQRLWLDPERRRIIVFVYEFTDRAGALSQLDEASELAEAQGIVATGSIEGILGSTVLHAPAPLGATAAGMFVKGSSAVQVIADGDTRAEAESILTRVARDQFDRLP
jgi:hypothetical protein